MIYHECGRYPALLRSVPEPKPEARRQFYVGVTRPRKALHIVYQKKYHSPFVAEVFQRLQDDS